MEVASAERGVGTLEPAGNVKQGHEHFHHRDADPREGVGGRVSHERKRSTNAPQRHG